MAENQSFLFFDDEMFNPEINLQTIETIGISEGNRKLITRLCIEHMCHRNAAIVAIEPTFCAADLCTV